ncbi:DUF5067 domain-containing protein [Periweissella cryptocerci]|uniref:DUF5067 domain-containing protein n=1 Tax=Periweissella cryptocerci TaxID=2506420 RepID=A0A4P6YSG4_9LACO|nr:DUF5067 domain-containing protein [Periweissella cryptocerci]QBO35649.1 DUF5067 domain-containing protein [Periweissella cryptocerci]
MSKVLKFVPILLLAVILTACGATKSNTASSTSKSTAASAHKPTKPADIKFTKQTLTTPQGTLTITGHKIAPSGVQENTGEKADKNQFIIYFTFKNTSAHDVYPADIWDKYVSATQAGKKLVTGNLAWSTAESADNNLLNRSVMPVKAGKQCKTLGMFRYPQKTTTPLTVNFTASNKVTIHSIKYPVK